MIETPRVFIKTSEATEQLVCVPVCSKTSSFILCKNVELDGRLTDIVMIMDVDQMKELANEITQKLDSRMLSEEMKKAS